MIRVIEMRSAPSGPTRTSEELTHVQAHMKLNEIASNPYRKIWHTMDDFDFMVAYAIAKDDCVVVEFSGDNYELQALRKDLMGVQPA